MSKKLFKIFNIVFLLIFLIIFIGTIFSNINVYFKTKWYFILISFFVILISLLSLFKHILQIKKITNKKEIIIYSIGFIFFILLQLIVSKYTVFEKLTWDFGAVYNAAVECAHGNYSMNELYYFFEFPNNVPILYFLTFIFKIALSIGINNLVLVGNIVNILMIDISVLFFILSVRKLFGKNYGIIALILIFLFTPLISYTNIFYTDTLSMPFPIIVFYLMLCLDSKKEKKKNIIYLTLIGIISFIGLKAKLTTIFVLIAFIIYIFIDNREKIKTKLLSCLVIIFNFVLCFIIYAFINNSIDAFTNENRSIPQMPYTHWIMMGTSETYSTTVENYINGIFNGEEYNKTYQYKTTKERKEFNIKVIKERIKERKIIGNVKFYYNKLLNTWDDGTYFASAKLQRYPKNTDNIVSEILIPDKKYFNLYFYFTSGIQLFMIFMFILSPIYELKENKYKKTNIIKIAVFGLLLFLLIWETRSRYLVNYIPLFMLLTIEGINIITKKLNFKI